MGRYGYFLEHPTNYQYLNNVLDFLFYYYYFLIKAMCESVADLLYVVGM